MKIAAECWEESGADHEAAEALIQAKSYALGAQYYRRFGLFDEMVVVLRDHAKNVPNALKKQLEDEAKHYYFLVCYLGFIVLFLLMLKGRASAS